MNNQKPQSIWTTLGFPTVKSLSQAVREGFKPSLIQQIIKHTPLELEDILNLLELTPATLVKRAQSETLFTVRESDLIYRAVTASDYALELTGSTSQTQIWLKTNKEKLNNKQPIDLLKTTQEYLDLIDFIYSERT